MDTNTLEENSQPEGLMNDDFFLSNLKDLSNWGQFLGIAGYIGTGLMALFGLLFIIGFSFFPEIPQGDYSSEVNVFTGAFLQSFGFFYILAALLYFFPSNYLYRGANRLKTSYVDQDVDALKLGVYEFKRLFKFTGILTAIAIGLNLLIFGAGILLGSLASLGG